MSGKKIAKDRYTRPRGTCVDAPCDTGFNLSNSERWNKRFRVSGLFDTEMNGGLDEEH